MSEEIQEENTEVNTELDLAVEKVGDNQPDLSMEESVEDSVIPASGVSEEKEEIRSIDALKTSAEDGVKTLDNITAKQASEQVGDIEFWGDGDTFKLISKASSKKEGWMKSTKAMEIERIGCVVQVTTQQGDNIAEALTFVPGAKIREESNSEGVVTSRKLVFK